MIDTDSFGVDKKPKILVSDFLLLYDRLLSNGHGDKMSIELTGK